MLRPGIAVLAFILPMASGLWTAKQAHMNELIQLSETAGARSVEVTVHRDGVDSTNSSGNG